MQDVLGVKYPFTGLMYRAFSAIVLAGLSYPDGLHFRGGWFFGVRPQENKVLPGWIDMRRF